MNRMEGLFAGPPRSYWDYVLSPHIVPFALSTAVAIVSSCCGVGHIRLLLTLCVGGATSALMFVLLPLPIFSPIGGKYHVGLKHIHSRSSEMMPPLVVFYPTEVIPWTKGISYIPFGDIRFLTNIASHARMPLCLLRDFLFVRLRVSQDSTPASLFDSNGTPLPVIVFSHGLYGYHRLYSCLLSDLAARGAVVVSIGHLDGSAAFMRDEGKGGREVNLKRTNWESPVCEEALAHRVVEMRQTLKRLSEKEFWMTMGFTEFDIQQYIRESPQVQLCGHSFGGSTALVTAMQEEQESTPCKNIVQSVVVFDPWYLPLQNKHFFRPIAEARTFYTTPTLMIHSHSWVNNQISWDFFQKLTNLVLGQSALSSLVEQEKRALFVTLKSRDTNHYSVSDVALLSPIFHGNINAMVPPRAQIVEWSNMVLHFFNRHKTLAKGTLRPFP